MNIKMQPIISSNIEAHGYDPQGKVLAISFKGGSTYHYHGVQPHHAEGLAKADSAGSYFHNTIKDKFRHTKACV